MKHTPEDRAAWDLQIERDISEFGCHVISVADPEEKTPSFTYSVGIQRSSGAPEAIVCGLRLSLSGFVINEYNRKVRAGQKFCRGTLYEGFLKGFPVYIEPTRKEAVAEYVLGCTRLYDGQKFSVVQIIYPSTQGVWPWQKAASSWLVENQQMLGRARPNRP